MSRHGWKQVERDAAALFDGSRYPANMGGRLDFETPDFVGQVKNPRVFSLAALEAVALEMATLGAARVDRITGRNKIGVVVIKRSGGSGRRTPKLLVMTAEAWTRLRTRYAIR